MELDKLGKVLALLREHGVEEFTGCIDGLTSFHVKLGRQPDSTSTSTPLSMATDKDPVRVAATKLMNEAKRVPRGKDGLTAEEQDELYGAVLDEMPPTTEG